jgi:cell division initiation protein
MREQKGVIMRKLTGIDIQLKEFNKSIRGYDANEVRTFLEDLAKQLEAIDYENKTLKEKLREKEMTIMDYKERENMLKETIMTAHKVTDGIKTDATREALQIVTQAKLKADGVLRESRQNLRRVIDEINRLKKQKMEIISSIGAMLDAQSRMLKQYEVEKDDTFVDLNIPHDTFSTLGTGRPSTLDSDKTVSWKD